MALNAQPNTHYNARYNSSPYDCYCLTTKTERSGNLTSHWKCWWWEEDSSGQIDRKYKSFACAKYGETKARQLCIAYLKDKLNQLTKEN